MKLMLPTQDMQDAYLVFVREWDAENEAIVPYTARLLGRSYKQWITDNAYRQTQAVGTFVPDHTYVWVADDGTILGALNLRHRLNDHLRRVSGHIGYGVRPSARRQGHAKAMLTAALPLAWQQRLNRVLVTCDKNNIASARTIQACGGVLENEVQDDDHMVQRYWIALEDYATV